MLSRQALLLTAALVATAPGAAPAEPRMPLQVENIVLTGQQPEWHNDRVRFWPDRGAYGRLFLAGSARVQDFPLPSGDWVDLDLVAVDLLTEDTRFFARGDSGIHEIGRPPMRFFRGKVAGDPASLVSLNLYRGKVAGFVRTGGTEYTFGPGSFAGGASNSVEVRRDATDTDPPGSCDGHAGMATPTGQPSSATMSLSEGVSMTLSPSSSASVDAGTMLLAHVAVEGTVEWVSHHGSVEAAEAYSLNLLAQVSAIYEDEIKVQLQVPYVLMNTSEPDGYTGSSYSTGIMLDEMVTKWNDPASGLPDVFRSVTHLFSVYPSGGAGRAYVNVLCDGVPGSTNARDMGVSLLSGNGGSWERGLVAHEIGHNFSSPHTHCYVPELDQCFNGEPGCYSGPQVESTGTIMSYCGSSLDAFHPRARDERLRPAAEAAYPTCLDVAGMPGRLDSSSGVDVGAATLCTPSTLQTGDGVGDGSYGYMGTSQAAWIKRLTPSCYPFKLTGVDVTFSNSSSVAVGRPVRIMVYTETAGTGDPVNATLVHSDDTTVASAGPGQWNRYTLSAPVTLTSGDFYLGVFDLEADTGTTYIMDYDSSVTGDSWYQSNSTDPSGYGSFSSGTWMIRGVGGGVDPGSLQLSWGVPCNDAAVPNQDYAIYQGAIGDWNNLTSLTCSTQHARSFLIETSESNLFWLVVPQNSANEGSYGRSSWGERPPAALPCKPQAMATCP